MLIEQAIFTSQQTSTSAGYQLVATTSGIGEADARELSAWGPSHDSLWEAGPAAASVNFFPLPSGAYCISQTTPAGAEYSQRRGLQIYTQSLVVQPDDLAAFANNPLALLQTAVALGHMQVHEKIPKRFEPFTLAADGKTIDRAWLAQLERHPGPVWLGALLHTALATPAIGIAAGERGPSLVAALINCLPMECRTEFSFTTGLRFSPRRPYRVICLPNHAPENKRLERQKMLTLLELKSPPPSGQFDGWAGFVSAIVHSGNSDYLAEVLAVPRPGLSISGLDALGNELIQGLTAWRAARGTAAASGKSALPADNPAGDKPSPPGNAALSGAVPGESRSSGVAAAATVDPWQRADGSHSRRPSAAQPASAEEKGNPPVAVLEIERSPAADLVALCPSARKLLEQLEDALFEAVAGKRQAAAELERLWPQALARLGKSHADVARQKYLSYSLSLWKQVAGSRSVRDPSRAEHVLAIVCLLTEPPM